MNELQMRQLMHRTARAVRLARRRDRVERDARGAIADDVHVRLDSSAIEREDRSSENVGLHHRRTAVVVANVWLEQGGGAGFERSVDAELGCRDREPRRAVLLAQPLDALDLGGNLAHVRHQQIHPRGQGHARVQRVLAPERQVGLEHQCRGVRLMNRRDAEGVREADGAHDRGLDVGRRRQRNVSRDQHRRGVA